MIPYGFERDYRENGYYFPLNVLDPGKARDYSRRIREIAESDLAPRLGNRGQLNQLHVVCPFVNDIIRNPLILETVASILGPNLMVWGTSVFIKPPRSASYVSWHQDLTYWGLSNDQEIAVWLALGPANRHNGSMKFLPGSHLSGLKPHHDTADGDNLLTRGQRADFDVDESQAVHVELEPGQASLHHGHLLHASGPNNTDQPRLGLVINYITPEVSQTLVDTDFAMLVCGKDTHRHFTDIPIPGADFDEPGLAMHHRMMLSHNEAIYDGAKNTDSALTPEP